MHIKISGNVTLNLTLQTTQQYTCVHSLALIVLLVLIDIALQGVCFGQLVNQHHRPNDRQWDQSQHSGLS